MKYSARDAGFPRQHRIESKGHGAAGIIAPMPRKGINALLVLFLCPSLMATTVVFVVTPEGIVVGADSKFVASSFGGTGINVSAPKIEKTAILQNRIVVASVGLDVLDLWGRKERRVVFNYNFATWIKGVEKKCPSSVSVSTLTGIVERESRATFQGIAQKLVDDWAPNRKQAPDFGIEYIVAGYESGAPIINYVHFKIDWNNLRFSGPFVESIYPGRNIGLDHKFVVFGKREVIDNMENRESDTYKQLFALIPKEMPKLLSGQDFTRNEAVAVCIAVLKFETEHNKGVVGPPYVINAIPPFGMGGVSRKAY